MIPNFTFSSRDASRTDTTTGFVDYVDVRRGVSVLLSLFGYNSGAQQWLQLFDVATGAPTLAIQTNPEVETITEFVALSHGLVDGDKVRISGITGIADTRFWFVHVVDANHFTIHDTLAEALAGTNAEEPSTQEDDGTLNHVPLHTFAIGAADNFSVIVPRTGINFSRGLVAAVSTTATIYTAGAKEVTMLGTLIA